MADNRNRLSRLFGHNAEAIDVDNEPPRSQNRRSFLGGHAEGETDQSRLRRKRKSFIGTVTEAMNKKKKHAGIDHDADEEGDGLRTKSQKGLAEMFAFSKQDSNVVETQTPGSDGEKPIGGGQKRRSLFGFDFRLRDASTKSLGRSQEATQAAWNDDHRMQARVEELQATVTPGQTPADALARLDGQAHGSPESGAGSPGLETGEQARETDQSGTYNTDSSRVYRLPRFRKQSFLRTAGGYKSTSQHSLLDPKANAFDQTESSHSPKDNAVTDPESDDTEDSAGADLPSVERQPASIPSGSTDRAPQEECSKSIDTVSTRPRLLERWNSDESRFRMNYHASRKQVKQRHASQKHGDQDSPASTQVDARARDQFSVPLMVNRVVDAMGSLDVEDYEPQSAWPKSSSETRDSICGHRAPMNLRCECSAASGRPERARWWEMYDLPSKRVTFADEEEESSPSLSPPMAEHAPELVQPPDRTASGRSTSTLIRERRALKAAGSDAGRSQVDFVSAQNAAHESKEPESPVDQAAEEVKILYQARRASTATTSMTMSALPAAIPSTQTTTPLDSETPGEVGLQPYIPKDRAALCQAARTTPPAPISLRSPPSRCSRGMGRGLTEVQPFGNDGCPSSGQETPYGTGAQSPLHVPSAPRAVAVGFDVETAALLGPVAAPPTVSAPSASNRPQVPYGKAIEEHSAAPEVDSTLLNAAAPFFTRFPASPNTTTEDVCQLPTEQQTDWLQWSQARFT
ncbi:hypothetical protein B0A50_01196 [Salinomyces thailandicus]|uniref:Uncharacterized protein n=1 Tax=Salinomyces thailandicus TaxID=706561 RepID=A0A4U0U9D0_9PEZI|nr:hypothetical protein B0A50_01196 [Salinomyces thailandica]